MDKLTAEKTFIPKLDASLFAIVGAADAKEFETKFPTFIQAMQSDLKAANDKIAALEAHKVHIDGAIGVTGESVRVIVKEEIATAAHSFTAAAKAEASRVAVEALGSVGGTPVRPAPAPAVEEPPAKNLIAAGKYEEAWAADKALQEEFPDAGVYAAYAKAASEGRVTVNQPK